MYGGELQGIAAMQAAVMMAEAEMAGVTKGESP